MKERVKGFVVVTAIYVLAAFVGVGAYLFLSGDMWWRLLIADVVATVFTFVFSVLLKNASVYDPYWSVQPIVILFAFLFAEGASLSGVLAVLVITLWGLRLTANWAYTFHGLSHQDWRYTMLKEKTGKFYPVVNFVGIHLVPTLVVYACTLPAAYVVLAGATFSPWSLVGFAICLIAATLQGVADVQMHTYRKNRTTNFIRTGLWKYSRHPNYLGEILMWWGVAVYTIATLGFSFVWLVGAVANTLLFLFVSIPLADGRQSKKEGFAEYKAETRALLPIKRFGRCKDI